MNNVKRMRRGSETIEIVFAVVATLCILFLVLNMFGDNIKTFVDNGGFPSTWNSSAAKTNAESWQIGQKQPSRINITTPEVQATSWDAILAKHNENAKKNIDHYYSYVQRQPDPATYQLADGDKKLLAMWLAVYANSSTKDNAIDALRNTKFEGTSKSYFSFGASQGIDLTALYDNYSIAVDSQPPYLWNNDYADDGVRIDGDAKARVSNIKDYIIPAFLK